MISFYRSFLTKQGYCTLFLFLLAFSSANAQGTWSQVTNLCPHYNGGVMVLLTDGSVIAKTYYGGFGATAGTTWDRLTPDSTGSYANGTWSTIANMNSDRLYFSSWVLNDGRVYVGGGEYGAGSAAEIYDPRSNTWSNLTTPSGVNFVDGVSENLPDGKLLLGAINPNSLLNYIYDPVANSYSPAASNTGSHDEVSWLKLPDSSILQVSIYSTNTERYFPATGTWSPDATVPVMLYEPFDLETGAAVMLPDGRGFFLGGTGHTAFYTPSGNSSPGTWSAGPDIPDGYVTADAPVAMLKNGKLLVAASPAPTYGGNYPTPTKFYEFDYTTNSFSSVTAPGGGVSIALAPYTTAMLDLPDGSVMMSAQASRHYYLYNPGGTPLAGGKPTVNNIIRNNCDTFTVTGKLFTGISEGASYGDDWAMSTNFPIIKINTATRSYYARSFGWNRNGSVMTGTLADTAQFELPAGLAAGSYTLQVIVNGIASDADSFNTSFSISPSTASFCAGSSTTISTAATAALWSSSNTSVATVGSSTGVVSGVSGGTATITCATGGCSAIATVTVTPLSTITASAATGGTISPAGATGICAGLSETYTITPGTGYSLSGVTVDGASMGAITSYTFTSVSAGSHNISASFSINTYSLTASAGAGGSISPSGVTLVGYGSSQAYSITPATGYYISDVQVDGSSLGAVSSYTFGTVSGNHTISATFAINTYTISATAGANGSITPSGTSTVSYGGSAAYSITPATGYYISDVQVDGSSVGAVSTYFFGTVSGNHTISATFAINTYTISATAGANGSITPSGTSTVSYGGSAAYSIAPATGYYISDVQVDGSSVGAVSTYSFGTVSGNHTISATFAINTYTISATAGANGSITPSGTSTVSYGGSAAYSIAPATGYYISDVQVDGSSVGAVSTYTFGTVAGNHTISATFAINTYTINATAGTNGSITPSGTSTVSYGGSATYSIAPATGYYISDVQVDGSSVGAVSTYTFGTVSGNHTVSATFAINTYTISATAGANGSITPSGVSTVSYGGSAAYSITPATGYHISDVQVDGSSVGAVSTYAFGTVSGNHTISATFAINTYTINSTAGANGSITPSGTSTVSYGGSAAYSITPSSGYHVSNVVVDGASVGALTTYSFGAVTANHTISATFAINSYSITAVSGSHGTVSPSGTTMVASGGNQAYSINPSSGYHVNNVVVDGASVGAVTTYNFTSVSANHTISATFAVNTYSITATSGSNGSVSPAGTTSVTYGNTQVYTISAASGYHVGNVVVDGISAGAVTSYTFASVTSNHTISASFVINSYSITASSGANGSVSPSGTTVLSFGGSEVYSITPAGSYHVSNVFVDGSGVGAVNTYTFTSVSANHTISATFAINTYNIVASAGSHGSVSPSGTTTVSSGGTQVYSISPSSGYLVAGVTVDGASVGAVTSYTFTSVTAGHTISASFAPASYTISSSSGPHGSISPNGSTSVGAGGNQSYSMNPNTGYHVSNVVVDGTSIGAVTTYTFTSVSSNHTIGAYFAANTPLSVTAVVSPSVTVTGQSSNTIYQNYGTQTVTLNAVPSGGSPGYTYSWSPSLSCTSPYGCLTATSPTVTTVYTVTVTDADGTTSATTVTLNYQTTDCSPNGDIHHHWLHHNASESGSDKDDTDDVQTKVCLCHSGHTLSVDSAHVAIHLSHGDNLGPCSGDAGDFINNYNYGWGFGAGWGWLFGWGGGSREGGNTATDLSASSELAVYPNPSAGVFNIVISPDISNADIMITDVSGRTIATRTVSDNKGLPLSFDLGAYAHGIYIVRMSSGSVVKIARITIQ